MKIRERFLSFRCTTPFCKKEKVPGRRGLCRPCYEIAMAAIRDGLVTEEQLVGRGMMDPKPPSKKSYFLSAAETAQKY